MGHGKEVKFRKFSLMPKICLLSPLWYCFPKAGHGPKEKLRLFRYHNVVISSGCLFSIAIFLRLPLSFI